MTVLQDTPLCPAGHLPLKGGDQALRNLNHKTSSRKGEWLHNESPISPLEGEMSRSDRGGWQRPDIRGAI
jgi:hypothetical protein